MPDYYHAPALVLIALLLPAFWHLYLRFRDTRTLLWFLAYSCSFVSMLLLYRDWPFSLNAPQSSWQTAAGETAIQAGSALFLASLSPLSFRLGRRRILFVIPYALPIAVVTVLYYGVLDAHSPNGPLVAVIALLGTISFVFALWWAAVKRSIPIWLATSFCCLFGGLAFWAWYDRGLGWGLMCVERTNMLMTALLVLYAFRRFSPGLVLTVMGFVAWALTLVRVFLPLQFDPGLNLALAHIIVMGKVVAAVGMILLILEDELSANKSAEERERRARRELEAYSNLVLFRRQVDDFDCQTGEICRTVAAVSRFSQVALLLESGRRFRLSGSAGIDPATARALDELAARIPASGFLRPGSAPQAVENCRTFDLDLAPWLRPGDDLRSLRFTSALAVPFANRAGDVEGAFLLAGAQPPPSLACPLRADDLLPIELLAARLQATRSQTMMFEKLIDSEKFAGLGQLAASVTQQMNNPLTVILGYASLLEETASLTPQDRKAVASVLGEARRMRATLESLSRIARPRGDDFAAVSVAELLADMEELHRNEFLRRSIEFRVTIAAGLPRALASAQQLRQAVLHCLHFAAGAVLSPDAAENADEPRTVRLEGSFADAWVRIFIAHSGPAFPDPACAFDPVVPAQSNGDTAAIGLSLCATIMRDNNGHASAVNLQPRGAAILLELPVA
ncbi:MAG TPA: histidine kinase dimerization/phospho-acceptor domain-containing protein [Terracidiphilus sp.]|nr:histidine kinase dimerization/phospho-acceptor domain-containing protein [Terracidiphilus sp.]